MASKSMSARYGHIKRKLSQDEPLKGKTLVLALEVIDENYIGSSDDIFLNKLREKIKSGQPLSEYEYNVFVEVMLLHKRLEA